MRYDQEKCHKAVRDLIPASLDKKGIRHEKRQARPPSSQPLKAMLDQEVTEYHASKDPPRAKKPERKERELLGGLLGPSSW